MEYLKLHFVSGSNVTPFFINKDSIIAVFKFGDLPTQLIVNGSTGLFQNITGYYVRESVEQVMGAIGAGVVDGATGKPLNS